jgi:hypothetical protein
MRRAEDIWVEQCRATERIRGAHGLGSAFDYLVGEKLLTFAEAATTRTEYARELPRFVAEVRRIFSAPEIRDHLARLEREQQDAAEAIEEEEPDELAWFDTPETMAARRDRFLALKDLLTAEYLGTS